MTTKSKNSYDLNQVIVNKNMLTTLINNGDIKAVYDLVQKRNFSDETLYDALYTLIVKADKFDVNDVVMLTQLIYEKLHDKSNINSFLDPEIKEAEDQILSQSRNLEGLAGDDEGLQNPMEANEEAIEALGKAAAVSDVNMIYELLNTYHYEPNEISDVIRNLNIIGGNKDIIDMLFQYNENNEAT